MWQIKVQGVIILTLGSEAAAKRMYARFVEKYPAHTVTLRRTK